MADLERVENLLKADNPLVWCPTLEEEYVLGLVRDAAMGLDRPMRVWTVVRGIADGVIAGEGVQAGTEQPAGAMLRYLQMAEAATGPEVYVALDAVSHFGDERTLRAARELCLRLEVNGGSLVLIDRSDALPAALQAHATRFDPSLPGDEEIEGQVLAVLRVMHREKPVELKLTKKEMRAVVENLRGLSRRHVRRVVVEAVAGDRKFSAEDLPGILARKRQLIRAEGLLEFMEAPMDMSDIGGLGKLKEWLESRRAAMSREAEEFGIAQARGVLMLGVQGAGKSLCCKAIATAWRRPLLRLDPGVLYDRYVGESERRLREALRQAEAMAPIVLWIDEIEKAFASAASRSTDGGLSQRMFGSLLTWLQEHRASVFVAATANDIEALPPELLRKGRFDEIFFVDLPGEAARRQIFEVHLRKRKRDASKFDLAALAGASEGRSGAEIEQAVVSALHEAYGKCALKPGEAALAACGLTTEMIVHALEGSPPLSVTMSEKIQELRGWAEGRCVRAE